jgi:hypothetical protein
MKNSFYSLLILLAIFSFSCKNPGKPKDFDYGRVQNGKYTNKFFQMEMNIPETWAVQSRGMMDSLSESSKDVVAGNNEDLKKAIDASKIKSANLLGVYRHPIGTVEEYNYGLVMVAENLSVNPEIKTGSDYLAATKKLLKMSQVTVAQIDESSSRSEINGQEFYSMHARLNVTGIEVDQIYYSTIRNGFCITTIISYTADDQKKELEKLVESIKFGK